MIPRILHGLLAWAMAMLVPGAAIAGDLDVRLQALLAEPALAGIRWGFVVLDDQGRARVSIAPDERFVPASNTKIFTTSAAFARLPGIDAPDPRRGTAIRIEARGRGGPDIALVGGGDAMLADGADCRTDCLATLADAVAARGIRRVRDVIGDDRRFPDERWGQGWSWNNLQTRSGTAVSALTIDDNEVDFTVTPASRIGDRAVVTWRAGDDYYALDDQIVTAAGPADIRIDRAPGSRIVRVHGSVPIGSAAQEERIAVDDPAEFAAFRLRRLLVARGIRVEGAVRARHRPLAPGDDPERRGSVEALPAQGQEIARLLAPPLADDLRLAAKRSQNLHAELALRTLGLTDGGTGSVADGLAVVDTVLADAETARRAYDLADGSGMSGYNRVTPRMVATYLRWTTGQPWGAAWRATLPVGAVDGTLHHRFEGTPLAGRVFAKTGSLDGVNALSGFFTAASGRTCTFALFAADQPSAIRDATAAMDRALLLVAAAN